MRAAAIFWQALPMASHILRARPRSLRDRLTAGLLAGLLLVTATAIAPAPSAAAGLSVERLAGRDRFATAAAISAATFAPGVASAYVATGLGFADALAVAPVAAREHAPVLLVARDAIPAPVTAELKRLAPQRIVVVGGPTVVSNAVLAALDAYDGGRGVRRIAGADRYETAARISAASFAAPIKRVFVATGTNYPDALAVSPLAGRSGEPLLLTLPDRLPAATAAELQRLQPERIVIVGGTPSVSAAVASQLDAYDSGGGVGRIGGRDRYDTSALISAAEFAGTAPAAFYATGQNFPDALAAGPAAAAAGAPLLLVQSYAVPASVLRESQRLAVGRIVLLGTSPTVSERVTLQLRVGLGDLAPVPACTYSDVLTAHRAYADWPRSLLDTYFMLSSGYFPGDLVDTSTAGLNSGYRVRKLLQADLQALAAAARTAGRRVQVVSGFRSYATQQSTFDYWVNRLGYDEALATTARPGHSEHQLGTTLDFSSWGTSNPWDRSDWAATPAGAWMAANAWRYGFVMSYPRGSFSRVCYDYEPWHYRYVGRDVAAQMHVSGLTPREWIWLHNDGS